MDVLAHYTARWVDETLAIDKWKDKKIHLDEFIKRTRVPTILYRDSITSYIALLKRLLTDNNINLLLCAFEMIQNLSKGLKRQFSHVAKNIIDELFLKLKDSKPNIVKAALDTLKDMINCLTLEEMMEDIKRCLDDKASNLKLQTIKFLIHFAPLKDTKIMGCLRGLVDRIVKLNEDGSNDVRNAAFELLSVLKKYHDMKFFGERLKHLNPKKVQSLQSVVTVEETSSII